MIRYSNVLASLIRDGEDGIVDVLTRARGEFPPCKVHGEIADPLVFMNQDAALFFGCPYCSGSSVLAMWEAEGQSSTTH